MATKAISQEGIAFVSYIQKMLRTEVAQNEPLPDFAEWQDAAEALFAAYQDGYAFKGITTAQEWLQEALQAALKADENFRFLYKHAKEPETAEVTLINYAEGFLPLGKEAAISGERHEQAKKARRYIDTYMDWSQYYSPRGHDLFHEGLAVWLLSALAMRRIVIPIGTGKYTPLNMLLIGNTSKFAKSFTLNTMRGLLRHLGYERLLISGNITPEAFYRVNSGKVDDAYAELSEAQQREVQEALRWNAKHPMLHDEWGQMLARIAQSGGYMRGMQDIILKMDDCPPSLPYITNARREESIVEPYMAFVGGLPLENMQNLPKTFNFWLDGFFARMILLSPPPNEWNGKHAPYEPTSYPRLLCETLQHFHETLGIPELPLVTERIRNGKPTGHYDVEHGAYPTNPCTFGQGTIAAMQAYSDDLYVKANTEGLIPVELHGNYLRFAEKVLRVAALLAWLDNGGRIERYHWDAAQEMGERWRESLHIFYNQLTTTVSEESKLERRIKGYLETAVKKGKGGLSIGEISGRLGVSSTVANRILMEMYKAGEIETYAKQRRGNNKATYTMYTTIDAPLPGDAYLPPHLLPVKAPEQE